MGSHFPSVVGGHRQHRWTDKIGMQGSSSSLIWQGSHPCFHCPVNFLFRCSPTKNKAGCIKVLDTLKLKTLFKAFEWHLTISTTYLWCVIHFQFSARNLAVFLGPMWEVVVILFGIGWKHIGGLSSPQSTGYIWKVCLHRGIELSKMVLDAYACVTLSTYLTYIRFM